MKSKRLRLVVTAAMALMSGGCSSDKSGEAKGAGVGGATGAALGVVPPKTCIGKGKGAIMLGCGGDCCKPGGGANLSAGTFYEGVMGAGYPSGAADDAVQENIVAAGYGAATADDVSFVADETWTLVC